MNMLRLATIGLVALGLVACGSSDPPASNNNNNSSAATFNKTGAKTAGMQVASAVSTILKGDGKSGANSLASAGMGALSVISYGGAGAAAFTGLGEASQADTSGTCDCAVDGKSCTFKGCTMGASGTSLAIDGTISWDNGKVACDLTYSGTSSGVEWDFTEKCDLTVTATSIDGTLKTTGSEKIAAQGQNVSVTWDASETFTGVKFPEGGGCPTAGTIDASATVTYNSQSFTGSGSATFDGTCGY